MPKRNLSPSQLGSRIGRLARRGLRHGRREPADDRVMALAELERPVPGPEGAAAALRLYRAWPEGAGRLALEYRDEVGRVVTGHWFATREAAREALRPARRRNDLEVERIAAAGGLVALYPPGDDALLRGLRPAVDRPGSELLSHRPWRRASVRLDSGSGPTYAKVLRPRRAARVAERARQATDLAGDAFATPRLREAQEDGVLIFGEVAGARLLEVVRGEGRDRALAALGEALRALHDAEPAESLAPYPHAEAARRLVDHAEAVESLAPAASSQLGGLARSIGARLEPPVGPPAPLHRDLNGTNMRITEAWGVGILDFDQLTLGDPAIDLGGALARLVGNIESFQRPLEEELAASAAFLEGYRPDGALLKRAEGHFRATLVQGACGCVLRPAGRPHLVPLMEWAADRRGLLDLLRGARSGAAVRGRDERPRRPRTREVSIALPRAPGGSPSVHTELRLRAPSTQRLPRKLARVGLAGYEPDALACFLAAVEHAPPGAVLDVGANSIAIYATLASALLKRESFAFEPEPGLAEVATAFARENGLSVSVEQTALGAEERRAALYLSNYDSSHSLAPGFRESSSHLEVRVETLDGWCRRTAVIPAVIKIDTETTEPDVIEGARHTIAAHRPWLLCEVLAGRTEERLAAALAPHGYRWHHVRGEPPFPPATSIEGDPQHEHLMWLFAPELPADSLWRRTREWRAALARCGPMRKRQAAASPGSGS